VEYLSDIVSYEGIKVYPNKIKTMMEWPIPKTLKNIRGFLGITRYYHKFFKNCGQVALHLTMLLKMTHFLRIEKQIKVLKNLRGLCILKRWPTPKNILEVMSFMGVVRYYIRFMKGFSNIAHPITSL
jgi:hypothetical protein